MLRRKKKPATPVVVVQPDRVPLPASAWGTEAAKVAAKEGR